MIPTYELLIKTFLQVLHTLSLNWAFILVSALVAATLKLYVDQNRLAEYLQHKHKAGILIATGAAVLTPLCSCGTTAVILGMMAGNVPWAPIIAFMVSSPLTSPQELIFSAGLFGWNFALTFFSTSILLGLVGGLAAHFLESRGWLKGQARQINISSKPGVPRHAEFLSARPKVSAALFIRETYFSGKKLVLFFLGFVFISYLINNLLPPQWIQSLFSKEQIYGVPIAAVLGIPFYFNTEVSLPIARAFLDAGMSQGAVLAFLITGAGTHIGAIAGTITIARWRVVALVVGTLFVGAIGFGYGYNAFIGIL